MKQLYKRLGLLALVFLTITGTVLYSTTNMEALRHFANFQLWALCLVALFWLLGMAFDGLRLMHLVQVANEKISFHEALQVIFGNYFLALLTPGAAGGAVAQVLFLKKAGVSAGKATLLVLVRTLLSILFLVLGLPWALLIEQDTFSYFNSSDLLLVAVAFSLLTIFALLSLGMRWPFRLLFLLLRPLSFRLRYKVLHFYQEVRSGWLLLLQKPKWLGLVFAESALSLWFLYSLVPALFWGFDGSFDYFQVMGRMILLNFLLYFAPTPGGSGLAEGGFVMLFGAFVPDGTVGIMAVAWRIIAEYIPFALGMYYAIRVFGTKYFMSYVK